MDDQKLLEQLNWKNNLTGFKDFLFSSQIPVGPKGLQEGIEEVKTIYTSLKGALTSKYERALFTYRIVITILNVILMTSVLALTIVHLVSDLDLTSWHIYGWRIPLMKTDLILNVFFLIWVLVFSLSYAVTLDKTTKEATKYLSVWFFYALFATVILDFIGNSILLVHKIVYLSKDECLIIIGLYPCTQEMKNCIYASMVISIIIVISVILYGIGLIILFFVNEFSAYRLSPATFEILRRKKKELKTEESKQLLSNSKVQKQITTLANSYNLTKYFHGSEVELADLKK